MFHGDGHEITGVGEPRFGVTDRSFSLQTALGEPCIHAPKAAAAMIGFRDHDPLRNAVHLDDARMLDRVRHADDALGDV